MATEFLYQPYYCEENVWHALHNPRAGAFDAAFALFVFSDGGAVPLWAQRAGQQDRPVVWDYHVVMVTVSDEAQVWDLDHTGHFPASLRGYLEETFPESPHWPVEFQPRFRLIERADFHDRFASDRSHMLDGQGNYRHPTPPWDPIGTSDANEWLRVVDPSDELWGPVMDRAALERRFPVSVLQKA